MDLRPKSVGQTMSKQTHVKQQPRGDWLPVTVLFSFYYVLGSPLGPLNWF